MGYEYNELLECGEGEYLFPCPCAWSGCWARPFHSLVG